MQTSVPISINNQNTLLHYDLILTPNQRLSSQLASAFDAEQISQGRKSWAPLPVYSFSNWLQNQWNDAVAAGLRPCVGLRVLSPDEETELWRQAVSHCYSGVLLARESAAQQVMQAWQTLQSWQLEFEHATLSKFTFFEDHVFFIDCVRYFEDLCEQQQAIASAKLAGTLATLPTRQSGRVLLYEFEELTPVQRHLLDAWQLKTEKGVAIQGGDSLNGSNQAAAHQFSSKQGEIRAAATWAKDIVAQDPMANVAVIVPDLNVNRDLVEDIFSQVFNADYDLTQVRTALQKFNISAGQSLAGRPLIEHALAMLELNFKEMAVESLPGFLYSPFLSSVCRDSSNDRSELEYRLRNYRSQTVSLSTIAHEAARDLQRESSTVQRCPQMAKTLAEFRQVVAGKGSLVTTDWLELFERQLQICGWPGTRTLDSIEYQQHQHWQEVLYSCQRLAAVRFGEGKKVSGQQCFETLLQCCREHIFQAKSASCRVQILGLLEGAGMLFSHTWLCDMGNKYWPAPARPSPYIPLDLQRQYRMPHCDAERELQFSGRLFANYRSHCSQLSMSYVDQDGDTPVPPSPFLLANASEVRTVDEDMAPSNSDNFREMYELESMLPVEAAESFPAVASIYEDQAACGFKAFARHRLRIRPPEQAVYGLDGRERGMLLHDSMEAVWRKLGDRDTLLASSAITLQMLIEDAVKAAMELARSRLRFRDSAVFLELEQQRLEELIEQWLEFERMRDDFSVIEFEVCQTTQIANRQATLRIDRVDRKHDGRLVLIEYKTGLINEAALLSDPPQAPQLPLYLSTYQNSLQHEDTSADLHRKQSASGVVLCRIDPQEPAWLGFGDGAEANFPRNIKQSSKNIPEWETLKVHWQAGLEILDSAFLNGMVQAQPVRGKQTCRLCDYGAVCRFALHEPQQVS